MIRDWLTLIAIFLLVALFMGWLWVISEGVL